MNVAIISSKIKAGRDCPLPLQTLVRLILTYGKPYFIKELRTRLLVAIRRVLAILKIVNGTKREQTVNKS